MSHNVQFGLWRRYVSSPSDLTRNDPTAYMGHDSTPASQQAVNQVGNTSPVGCTKCWFIVGGIVLLVWLSQR